MALKYFKLFIIVTASFLFLNCSATNPAVDKFFDEAVDLHKEKISLERKYLNILGHLQKFPNERTLRLQQADLKKELAALKVRIDENRAQLDLSIKQWEDAVTEKRTEEIFIQKQEQGSGNQPRRRRRRTR